MERDRYYAEKIPAASLYGASASTSEAASQRSRATIDRGLEILGVDFALRRRGGEEGER
jgi:hypothetical protein